MTRRPPHFFMPWLIFIVLLSLVFPMQVEFDNPNMALVPYIWLTPFLLLTFLFAPSKKARSVPAPPKNAPTDILVFLYLCLLIAKDTIAVSFGVIAPSLYFRTLFIYVLPISFYYYARFMASDKAIKAILTGIVLAAIIIGGYWVYDTILKAHYHVVSEYQHKAQEYTNMRQGISLEDSNAFRIIKDYRAWGLLGRNTFSAAWISLGVFAALALIPEYARGWRRIVLLTGIAALVIGESFSGMFSFAVTYALMYTRSRRAKPAPSRASISAKTLAMCVLVAVILGSTVHLDFSWVRPVFDKVTATATGKIDDVFGDAAFQWTLLSGLKSDTLRYLTFLWDRPYALLIGELHGGPAMEFMKGGDFGFLDDMAVVGIPFFALMAVSLFVALRRFRRSSVRGVANDYTGDSYVYHKCALSMLLSLVLMEVHYTVVFEKSLFPVAAIALGLLGRYPLPKPLHRRRPSQVTSKTEASYDSRLRLLNQDEPLRAARPL